MDADGVNVTSDPEEANRPASGARAFTVLLSVGLTVASSILLWKGGLLAHGMPDTHLAWWALALMSFAALAIEFHIEYRRETFSFTFSEIVMVLGLFLASPWSLVIGRLAGEVLYFLVRERDAPRKTVLNLSSSLAELTVLLAVLRLWDGPDAITDPIAWMRALVAVCAANLVGYSAVYTAMRWHGAPVRFGRILVIGALTAPVNTSFALVAGILLVDRPWATLLLVGVAAFLVLSYHSYTSLKQRFDSLSMLYEFTRLVSGAQRPDAILESILAQAKDLLRAERAEIWLRDETSSLLRLGVDDRHGRRSGEVDAEVASRLERWFASRPEATIVTAQDSGDELESSMLAALAANDCIIAPITESGSVVGLVAVIDRLNDINHFGEADRNMFATLANHASVALENGRLIDRLHHEAKVREHEALHDALTGLPNRVLLANSLRHELAVPLQRGEMVAVAVIDLDGFKEINDTLGHHTGDLVLVEIAHRLRFAAAEAVLVARLGGDEFALVMRADDRASLEGLARRVLDEVGRPLTAEGIKVNIGASIGMALAPLDAADAPTLLQRADVAMYSAKAGAGKGVAFYDALRDENSPRRLALTNDLRSAVAEHQLFVMYQPKAALADRRITGFEALVRWHHPQFGHVFPDEFIPLAERTSIIGELTVFVLNEALSEAARWRAKGHEWTVAVNVAMRNLLDDEFVEEVRAALAVSGCPPSSLTLEITETSVMSDTARTIEVLRRLAALGVRLSVDDFGTGYSSLSYLQQLPVEEIKIDQLFVREMSNDSSAEAIVRSVLDLARNLGLRVVAEGVEDGVLWERLRDLRCEIAQGYHLSRPMLPGDVEEWARMWDADEPEPMPLVLTGRSAPRRA